MKTENEGPVKKMAEDKDDATKPFTNAEKDSAKVVNDAGDDKSRNYMGADDDINGPNMDKESKEAEGDTTVNAGIFK